MSSIVFQKGTLLNAVTGTGTGPVFSFDKPYRSFSFNKRITGVFSALVIAFEGSIDGLNWFQVGTDNAVTAAPTFVADKPVMYLRGNCTTFTGGTNTTVDFLAVQ